MNALEPSGVDEAGSAIDHGAGMLRPRDRDPPDRRRQALRHRRPPSRSTRPSSPPTPTRSPPPSTPRTTASRCRSSRTRATSPRCARCATSTASARSCRSPTSTSRRSRRRAPTAGDLPEALVPRPRTATRDLRQVRGAPDAGAARAAVAADRPARRARRLLPGDGQAAARVGGRVDPPGARRRARRTFFARYLRDKDVMVQRRMDGPEFSIDCLSDTEGRCLNAIPRSMLESRGGESIKGTVLDDPELVDLGRDVVEALGGPRAVHRAGLPRPARSASASPTSTRASAARSPRRCTRRCRAAPTRS